MCKISIYKGLLEAGDYVPVGYWSTIEVHVSVICACLPAIPSLFQKKPSISTIKKGSTSAQTAHQPVLRNIDVLPLLKVASGHQRVSPTDVTSYGIEPAKYSNV
jgi:hypothetical protein